MLENNILFENKLGYVMKCKSCKQLQIALGNIVSKVSYDGFYNLKRAIDKINNSRTESVLEDSLKSKVVINTPVEHFWISFDSRELKLAKELFDISDLMLETEKILHS